MVNFYSVVPMATPKLLAGHVALITGGTSGIGKATAKLFAQAGAKVAFSGRRVDLGASLAAEINDAGGQALFIPADHTHPEDCQRCVDLVMAEFGRLDILFNNAGIVVEGTAESTSEVDWQDTLNLNVTAVWRMSKLVIPHMRTQGSGVIVNNASDWGLVGARNALAYAASKGAVVQMTRSMALDHAHEQIRVNAVCPGDTIVERWLEAGYFRGSAPVTESKIQGESSHLPMRRAAQPDEIAQAVLFLASELSSYITGAALPVDGGNTAQ